MAPYGLAPKCPHIKIKQFRAILGYGGGVIFPILGYRGLGYRGPGGELPPFYGCPKVIESTGTGYKASLPKGRSKNAKGGHRAARALKGLSRGYLLSAQTERGGPARQMPVNELRIQSTHK